MTQPQHHRSDTGEEVSSVRGSDVNTTAQVITTSGTILVGDYDVVRLAPAAAVTGVIMPLGQFRGQQVQIINTSAAASSVTMAAAGTSNVADGTGTVIAGVTAATLVWDDQANLWFHCK